MSKAVSNIVTLNPWEKLKAFTDARIAIGRAGSSLPTSELLKFQLEHAKARDAVHLPLNPSLLLDELKQSLSENKNELCPPALDLLPDHLSYSQQVVTSQAMDRGAYLQRPDLGRLLNQTSIELLSDITPESNFDLSIVCVDGLSSVAIQKNVAPFLLELLRLMAVKKTQLTLAPIMVCTQGRVAIGDHVAETLRAKTVMVLVGERPGLSSPDSMGLYLTYGAKVGCHDAQRNCISNIRPGGLSYKEAASKAMYLIEESQRLKLSGVNLKERTDTIDHTLTSSKSFLTGI
jgi:ethanolamine ammonia-lyase small subunit